MYMRKEGGIKIKRTENRAIYVYFITFHRYRNSERNYEEAKKR